MKIIFYDAKQYDIDSFEKERKNYPDIENVYLEADLIGCAVGCGELSFGVAVVPHYVVEVVAGLLV